MTRRFRLAAACLVAALVPSLAWAHDYWIELPKFRVARGEAVSVHLRYGERYEGEPSPRSALRIEKFVVLGPDGVEDVPGEEKKDPAGRITPAKDGIYVVAYRSKRKSIELIADKFESYLKEEGLERISKIREERKETDKAGLEVYSRCAKAILKVGEGAKEGHDRIVGQRLEIVPETNPYTVASGAEMTFRMLYEEKPLAEALLVARSRAEPKHTVSARTAADGRVKLTLDRAGEWMVKCVHMVEAPKETAMDWESLWASVTFDLAAPAEPGAAK